MVFPFLVCAIVSSPIYKHHQINAKIANFLRDFGLWVKHLFARYIVRPLFLLWDWLKYILLLRWLTSSDSFALPFTFFLSQLVFSICVVIFFPSGTGSTCVSSTHSDFLCVPSVPGSSISSASIGASIYPLGSSARSLIRLACACHTFWMG